jgi:short-subunit dehydrogenase
VHASPHGTTPRRVAVITGASAGIGRATAQHLAKHGYDVGLLSRGESGLQHAADDVLARGGRAVAVKADVGSWEQVRDAANAIEAHLGPIDVWINNAMVTVFGPVSRLDADEIRRVTETTYLGQVYGALAALELMRPRNAGTIVSVSSTLAYRSIPLQAAYCGAKAGARGFMDALRVELLHEHSAIRITQVVLPAVNTPQFHWSRSKMPRQPQPVEPIYAPEVAARAILDAVRYAPRRRVVGTWNRLVLKLNKLAPGVLDHAAARAGWEGQQGPADSSGQRRDNLDAPLDDAAPSDAGVAGAFVDSAGGVLDTSFLRTLPDLGRTLGHAAVDRVKEVTRSSRP